MSLRSFLLVLMSSVPLLAQQASKSDPWFLSGVAKLKAERYADAQADFRRVYELEPENLRGLMGIAQVYMAQKNFEAAIQAVQTESAKSPERADFHILIGDLDVQASWHDAALNEYQHALALMDTKTASDLSVPRGNDPLSALTAPEAMPKGAAGVYLRIGREQFLAGDPKAAAAAYRKAKELLSGDNLIVTNLAMALEGSGDKKGAMEQYRAALALQPANPVALNNLAFLIADVGGDLYEALRLARRAKQLAPQLLEISDTIGWVSLKLGWTDDAILLLKEALRKQPAQDSVRGHLIAALDQKQDRSAEVTALRKALAEKPSADNLRVVTELLGKEPAK